MVLNVIVGISSFNNINFSFTFVSIISSVASESGISLFTVSYVFSIVPFGKRQ